MTSRAAMDTTRDETVTREARRFAEIERRLERLEQMLPDIARQPPLSGAPELSEPTPSGRLARPPASPAVPRELDPAELAKEDPST